MIVVLFFFSGAAGLIYEVLWNRLLGLEMGHTARSLAAILTVFMGGLALGSWIGGRLAHRVQNGLRVYGWLELAIGLYCLALPHLIDALTPIMAWLYRGNDHSFAQFNLAQFAVAGAVLLVPVTLMGATLPIVAEHVTRRRERVGGSVGLIYAVNTVGAFVGCMVAGMLLIPQLGVATTNVAAVGTNLAVGAIALVLARSAAPVRHLADEPASDATDASSDRAAPTAHSGIPTRLLLFGFGLSGFAAMAYQVAWTRVISLSIGSATYAFTLIVGAFILGLAIGAAILGRIGQVGARAAPLLAGSQLLLALAATLMLPAFDQLPAWVAAQVYEHRDAFATVQRAEFLRIFLIVLVPTFLMGGALPLIVHEISRRAPANVGAVLGRAYAANTIGTILGSFLTGFVLVPWVGVRGAIVVGVAINAIVGVAWWCTARREFLARRLSLAVPAAAALVGLTLAMPEWNRTLLTSAPYEGAEYIERQKRVTPDPDRSPAELFADYVAANYELLAHREDVATTVTITRDRRFGEQVLRLGGKSAAAQFDRAQALLAHLPLALHPDPQDVLIVGLGAGGTLESTLRHEHVRTVQNIEISPAVVDVAREWFGRAAAFDDPRTEILIGDGRLHLALAERQYDVILSQPSNPWIVGASALFTRDCFEEMRARLKPGGLACIWMQGFQIGIEPVRTLFATFAAVFEHMDVFENRNRSEYFLIGALEPLAIDPVAVAARVQQPRVRKELSRLHIRDAVQLLSLYLGDRAAMAPFMAGAGISTDDHNLLEADIPKSLFQADVLDVTRALYEVREPITERWGLAATAPAAVEWAERAAAILRSSGPALDAMRLQQEMEPLTAKVIEAIAAHDPNDELVRGWTAGRRRKLIALTNALQGGYANAERQLQVRAIPWRGALRRYFYLREASRAAPNEGLWQEVWELQPLDEERWVVTRYRPPDATAEEQLAWLSSDNFAGLAREDLVPLAGCGELVLKESGPVLRGAVQCAVAGTPRVLAFDVVVRAPVVRGQAVVEPSRISLWSRQLAADGSVVAGRQKPLAYERVGAAAPR
ncbi:MAG: fused MFS/spermidine synthase [Planctomycetota bacterium]